MKQLRTQAKMLNLPGIRGESKSSLAARVQAAMTTMTAPPKPVIKGEAPVFPKHYTSPDELIAALEPYKGKGLQIKVDADSWHMKYGIAEDSGTMHQPLTVIKRMAEMLLMARMPAKIKTAQNETVLSA